MVDPVGKPLVALKKRRRLALVGLFAIIAISIGSAIIVERSSSARQHELVNDLAERVVTTESLRAGFQKRTAAARGFLLTGASELLDERRLAREELELLLARIGRWQPPAPLLAELRDAMTTHDAASNHTIELRATDAAAAISSWEALVRPSQQRVAQIADRIAAKERERFHTHRETTAQLQHRARLWIVGSGVLVLLVVLWTVRLFSRMESELVRHVRREQRTEMFQLLEQVPVGIYVVDAKGAPYYANAQALSLLGNGEADHVDKLTETFRAYEIGTERIYPTERAPIVRALAGEKTEISDMELRREDGAVPLHVRGAPVVVDDRIAFAVAAFQDVRELRRLATRDALTGLPNRGAIIEMFARERLLAERGEYTLGLAMIDFDRFKSVNDTYGHAAGDAVLIEGGKTIAQALRRTDVLARWGGEELVVLLPKATIAGAKLAIEKALVAIRALEMHAGERTFHVSFSSGVVEVGKGESLEAAVHRADLALYQAKHEGRDRVIAGK